MRLSFHNGNNLSNGFVSFFGDEVLSHCFYNGNMKATGHQWFLKEWLETKTMKQADLVKLTDWSKGKVSKLCNGKADYDRSAVNEASRALEIEPFELLMSPQAAMSLRQLRQSAIRIASDSSFEQETNPYTKPKSATG